MTIGSIKEKNNNLYELIDHKFKSFDGWFKKDVNLSKYNTWRVGGTADYVFKPQDLSELAFFLSTLYEIDQNIDIRWLGLGSNVLIRDGGYRGIIILTNSGSSGGLNNLELSSEGLNNEAISVGAGVACAKLAKFLAKHDYPSGAFWAGIPGTMGGALAMNAGCYGYETWEFVIDVDMISRDGKIITLHPEDFHISYRSLRLKNERDCILNELWFVNSKLRLAKDFDTCGRQQIKDLLQQRGSAQPIGQFSGGSVFKNPKGSYAAKLIQESGLKSYAVGGAHVSSKHANFIINDKTATAKDIELLIKHIQSEVLNKYSVKLEPEIKIIGES